MPTTDRRSGTRSTSLVLPTFLSVVFDPTLRKLGNDRADGPLSVRRRRREGAACHGGGEGHPEDVPARPRPAHGFRAVERPRPRRSRDTCRSRASRIWSSNRAVPSPSTTLLDMLRDEARKQGKPFGLLFDNIEGGFTNTGRDNRPTPSTCCRTSSIGSTPTTVEAARAGARRRSHRHAALGVRARSSRPATRSTSSTACVAPRAAAFRCPRRLRRCSSARSRCRRRRSRRRRCRFCAAPRPGRGHPDARARPRLRRPASLIAASSLLSLSAGAAGAGIADSLRDAGRDGAVDEPSSASRTSRRRTTSSTKSTSIAATRATARLGAHRGGRAPATRRTLRVAGAGRRLRSSTARVFMHPGFRRRRHPAAPTAAPPRRSTMTTTRCAARSGWRPTRPTSAR